VRELRSRGVLCDDLESPVDVMTRLNRHVASFASREQDVTQKDAITSRTSTERTVTFIGAFGIGG
jgi:hypothetical protein